MPSSLLLNSVYTIHGYFDKVKQMRTEYNYLLGTLPQNKCVFITVCYLLTATYNSHKVRCCISIVLVNCVTC